MKKKYLIGGLALISMFALASCGSNNDKPTNTSQTVTENVQYFDSIPSSTDPYDHYFSNKITLASVGATVGKDANGKLCGNFIADKIAKCELKSFTDGDTAVFYLNNGEQDIYTVAGKSYAYVTVRFLGIDTPESTSSIDPWGKKASKYGKELLTKAAGIILDATDLENNATKKYVDRLDSNGSRWLSLVWYCPEGKDPENLANYRSYQLDMIEECYTYCTSFSTTRYGYNANKKTEPILYNRYYEVKDLLTGELQPRYGSLLLNEVMYEADNRMQRTGEKLRIQGEVDDGYDYNKTPTRMTITEAYEQQDTLMSRGTFVELTGVITRFIGNNFYFEDANGKALYVYMGIQGNSINDIFAEGDTIRIRGRICEYGGQLQMSGIVFKRETFVKVTDENEQIAMPAPVEMTGNETEDEIKALLGKLVTTTITASNIGSQSKDGSFSITDTKVIKGLESLEDIIDNTKYYSSINRLSVRINGSLAPGYDYQTIKSAGTGVSYKVTGIMSIYDEEDYTKDNYASYQILPGNRRVINGQVVNEFEKQ